MKYTVCFGVMALVTATSAMSAEPVSPAQRAQRTQGAEILLPQRQEVFADPIANARQSMDMRKYKPTGVRTGSFILHPSIGLEETYDNNIFRRPDDEESDFITVVKPGLELNSDWNNHQLDVKAVGDLGYYADNDSENFNDYLLSATGRLDIVRDTYFTGGLRQQHLHEYRNSPNNLGGDEPPEFDRSTGEVGFARELARWKLYTNAVLEDITYDENFASGLPAGIVQERDRTQQAYSARVAYELMPGYDAFVGYTYGIRDFDQAAAAFRDSDSNEYNVGTAFSLTGTARGEAYVGYFDQSYDQGNRSLDFINYGGSVTWNITPLTSLQGLVRRDVLPTVFSTATDYIETTYGATLAHALTDDVIIDARARYIEDDFKGINTAIERNDDIYVAGAGVKYLVNREWSLGGTYNYIERDSNIATQNYSDNIVGVSVDYIY